MAFRIGVLGMGAITVKKAQKASEARGGEAVILEPGRPLPADVVAVAGPSKDIEGLIGLASTLAKRQDDLLMLLAQAIDAREGIPLGNAERLRSTAVRFGEAMALDGAQRSMLIRGALIHDIGKIALSNSVLLTKAMLTHDEWQELRAHTVKGQDIALALPGFEDTTSIIRGHHECWDGTGYPDELEGEEIPLLARAMKVIDVFCSMTGPRHYRTGMASATEAFEHLEDETGKHFDPELARLFLKTFR